REALSGIHENDLADTARAAGDAYIPNSYSPCQLLAKVREYLSSPARRGNPGRAECPSWVIAAVRPTEDLVRFAFQSRPTWLVDDRPLRAKSGHLSPPASKKPRMSELGQTWSSWRHRDTSA